jgi:hypothetical protein
VKAGDKKSLVHTYTTRHFGAEVIQEKTTGRKKLKLHSERFYNHEINKFKAGDEVTISITNKKPRRTEQQNRYYWGAYLPMISEQTGEHDLDSLHTLFKGKFLTKKIVKVLGYDTRITGSTTDLSVNDFCEYIMNIEALTGIQAPPPENYDLAPLKK